MGGKGELIKEKSSTGTRRGVQGNRGSAGGKEIHRTNPRGILYGRWDSAKGERVKAVLIAKKHRIREI